MDFMEQEIFRAGVRPGGPTTNDEIKILICYILTKIGVAMSFAQIHEALEEHELVNYFELVAAVDSLAETGHIESVNVGNTAASYVVTKLGESTANEIDGLLPPVVREKAVDAADKLLRRKKREQDVVAQIAEAGDGYEVKLSIPNENVSLVAFTVFCPTKEEAELVRKRFLNDPTFIYIGTLALLTGDKDVLGEIFPSKEVLF